MTRLKAPFPYAGGKSAVASVVWQALGDVRHYIEPFFGSGAVLLGRPGVPKVETVNDADGLLLNVWRAIRLQPDAVADELAGVPPASLEVAARAKRLRERRVVIIRGLVDSPDWCDPVAAADWIYGAAGSIGGDWAKATDGDPGQGVNALHLGNPGQGVNALHLGDPGQGVRRRLAALSARLSRVRLRYGDWTKVVSPAVLDATHGEVGVFLDPPYDDGQTVAYAGGNGCAPAVGEWCRKTVAKRPGMRIVLAGLEGDHDLPGWRSHRWARSGGYANQGANGEAKRKAECLWLSPGCLGAGTILDIAETGR